MYCVYCGGKLKADVCTKCKTTYEKKAIFKIKTNMTGDLESLFCLNCANPIFIITDKRPEEFGGLCLKCSRPARIDRSEQGDTVFI